ncbi:MAG TPA: hypothetical protein VJS44_17070 [Pyrinomonadaceae bacterium]|nr:hypothetical protein [Pyrinomonadaceae bacterium]
MKDDYLWDKSGEPDPEIERLERIMGGLRSRRGAEDLMPAFEKLSRRKSVRPSAKWLAFAATVAFAVLALGVFGVMQRQTGKQETAKSEMVMVNPTPTDSLIEEVAPPNTSGETGRTENDSQGAATTQTTKRSPLEARRRNIVRRRESFITQQERTEGLLAKEQLLKALQITSTELDSVQKKVQGDEKAGPSS